MENYQVELSKNINVPGIVSKLFRNRLFRMVVNILLSTIDKNDGIEDENNNENLNFVLSRNEDLNDQTNNCSQAGKNDVGMDIGERREHWDKITTFQNTYNPT